MKRYILIQPDEDGNPIRWLSEAEVKDIKQLMEDYGVDKFITSVPEPSDPNYWDERTAMLLEVEIKDVVPVKVVEQYEIK